MIPVILVVGTAVFLLIYLIPGDPAQAMLGPHATPEALEKLRRQLNLDKPWYIQYPLWLVRVFQGDLGISVKSKRPVLEEILNAFPHTIELVFLSLLLIAIPVGITLGVLASVKQHSLFDYVSTTLSVVGVSMPAFWLGLLLILLFSIHLKWFPIFGLLDTGVHLKVITHFYIIDALLTKNFSALGNYLFHMILPSVVLATIPLSYITRMTRSSMLDILRTEYINTARAKGLSELKVILKHALRNALIPVIIVSGTITGLLLGGAVLTETIFGLPGMGRLLVNAILERDFPLVQGCILIFAFSYNFINLITDIICQLIEPKGRYG